LLGRADQAEIQRGAADAAELKRIGVGADHVAADRIARLELQRIAAAGEGDSVGLTEVIGNAAGNNAAVGHRQVGADDAGAADAPLSRGRIVPQCAAAARSARRYGAWR
jgi:hypothetical protein